MTLFEYDIQNISVFESRIGKSKRQNLNKFIFKVKNWGERAYRPC